MSWRRLLLVALGSLLLGLLVAGSGAWWGWRQIQTPFGTAGSEVSVVVPAGLDARGILARLEEQGVLRNATLARFYLVYFLGDPSLKAGEYRFRPPLAASHALDTLIRGAVTTYPVTLVEGLTLEETAGVLAESGFGERSAFLAAMSDPSRIADLDPAATSLEGYLFPDTYSFAHGTSERRVVATLVDTFRRRYLEEVRPLLGNDTSTREVVTLASIVEKEAQLEDERRLISGVYANRLRIGMALYADPTIIYALKLASSWDGNLRRQDLKLDSPYNTYLYPGLPPGPICSPGLASLVATASPSEEPYLYFVSRNDGSHVFAKTLREHNRNVERWQKQYWRERWASERAAAVEEGD